MEWSTFPARCWQNSQEYWIAGTEGEQWSDRLWPSTLASSSYTTNISSISHKLKEQSGTCWRRGQRRRRSREIYLLSTRWSKYLTSSSNPFNVLWSTSSSSKTTTKKQIAGTPTICISKRLFPASRGSTSRTTSPSITRKSYIPWSN